MHCYVMWCAGLVSSVASNRGLFERFPAFNSYAINVQRALALSSSYSSSTSSCPPCSSSSSSSSSTRIAYGKLEALVSWTFIAMDGKKREWGLRC